ncbi:hypothetical protein ACA910_007850 [Epithemia clementina (nom. ined.)]
MERPLPPTDVLRRQDSGNIVLLEDRATSNPSPTTAVTYRRPKEFLQQANQLVKEEKYVEALRFQDRALEFYKQQPQRESVVSWCSEATAWRNKGAIHRKLKDYTGALEAWQTAEELFRNCRERVLAAAAAAPPEALPRPAFPRDKQICLDACIVDVLQSRAYVYMKLNDRFRAAIDCHEEVIDLLLDIHRAGEHDETARLREQQHVPLEGVSFIRLDPTRNTEALVNSLEALGGLYTSTGAYEDGLAAFEEALQILRARQQEGKHDPHIIHSMSKILYNLSELYFERDDLERTIDTLLETVDLQISLGHATISNVAKDALLALDRAGQVAEEAGKLDFAISCYEKVLLTRNHFWGDKHIDVAKSLVNVGRVLELQGNTEGSLDLYRAAQTIYAAQVTADDFVVTAEDVETVLQLIPSLFEQDRYEEAVAYLNKCLESEPVEDEKKTGESLAIDRTQIYFTLGEAYIGMGDYVTATVCLVECAKQEGAVREEEISMMLERVEQLKREEQELGTPVGSEDEEDEDGDYDRKRKTPSSPRPATDELSFPAEEAEEGEAPVPVTPESREKDETNKNDSHNHVSTTPTTEEISQNGSQVSGEAQEPLPDEKSKTKGVAKASRRFEKTRFGVKSGDNAHKQQGQTDLKHCSSDLSSSLLSSSSTSALDLSHFSVEDARQNPPTHELSPRKDLAETDSLLRPSRTADSNERRKSRALRIPSPRKKVGSTNRGPKSPEIANTKSMTKLALTFRRQRRGFESLPEEDKEPIVAPVVVLKREEEYHDDESNIGGPVKYFHIPTDEGWDDVSQITFVYNDGSRGWQRSNEWWWGVTAEGFGRWFPSQFVSQAVEAADGFLSARAIHSKVRSAPLDIVSDDESTDSRIEDKDHASNVGVAAKDKMSVAGLSLGINETPADAADGTKKTDDLQAMIAASSSRRLNNKEDSTEQEIAKLSGILADQRHDLDSEDPLLATTLFRLAWLQSRSGDIPGAIQSSSESLRIQQANDNPKEVARTLHFLADLYLHQKQYKSSLAYYMEALDIEQEVYGEYSEESAKTLNSIGAVRAIQNEFKLAMESHKEALRVLKECLGDDLQGNPLVSQTLCQIGAVYYRERNALSTIKSKKDDYSTFVEAGMLEVIGRAHEERGSYKMAIAFFEEKLQFLENDSDESASREDLATTLNSLGMLSSRAGLFMEALDYYDRALAVQRSLGCDSIYLATAQVLKGTVKYQLGLWNEALGLLESALTTLREELGPDHETVAATLYHIGVVKAALCDYDTAMAALKDALQIQNTLLGHEHPAALRTRREIGIMFAVYPSELATAFEHFTQVLAGQQKIHGLKHPNIAETLHAIGCAYARKRDYGMALKTLEECYYMRLEFLGVDHPLQATTLHEIAKIHVKRESFKKALRICDTVLDIRRESLSEGHIDYARALATKGSSLVGRGDFGAALRCAGEALRVCTEALEEGHPVIAETNVAIAAIHLRNCQFTEALAAVNEALSIYRQSNIDDDYPGLQEAQMLLERIERDEMLFV